MSEFDYQQASLDSTDDATTLFGIVSETDGGIVAYAISRTHAEALVRALNAASGEYEAEMVSAEDRL